MIKKKNISNQDLHTWNKFIKNLEGVTDKDKGENTNEETTSRYKFDLHGYNLIDANKKVKELILHCREKNFKEILLITGKGKHSNTLKDVYSSKDLSKLKYSVPEYIKSQPELSNCVISITGANKYDGGDGAIIIKLKKL